MANPAEETKTGITGQRASGRGTEDVFPVIGMQYECIWVRDEKDRTEKVSLAQLQDCVRNRTLSALDRISFDGHDWTRLGMTRIWREAFSE